MSSTGPFQSSVSSAYKNIGDCYLKMQGKMGKAIEHYKECLLNEQKIGVSPNQGISKIYAETFMKLFNTKMQCCDWNNYYAYIDELKKIILKQY